MGKHVEAKGCEDYKICRFWINYKALQHKYHAIWS